MLCIVLLLQAPFELAPKPQQPQQQQQQQPMQAQRTGSGRSASSSRSSSPGPQLLLSRQQLAAQQQQVWPLRSLFPKMLPGPSNSLPGRLLATALPALHVPHNMLAHVGQGFCLMVPCSQTVWQAARDHAASHLFSRKPVAHHHPARLPVVLGFWGVGTCVQLQQRLARAGGPRRRAGGGNADGDETFYDASPATAYEEDTATAAADMQPLRFHDAGAGPVHQTLNTPETLDVPCCSKALLPIMRGTSSKSCIAVLVPSHQLSLMLLAFLVKSMCAQAEAHDSGAVAHLVQRTPANHQPCGSRPTAESA